MKKVIYVNMDGVLVKEPSKEQEESKRAKMNRHGKICDEGLHWTDIPDIYLDLAPVDGAIESFNKLTEDYDMYVVSTVPWANPSAWIDKKKWIDKYLPAARKKLIFTHHKELLSGEYLIDDRLRNGTDKFVGSVIHFGQDPFKDWGSVINFLDRQ